MTSNAPEPSKDEQPLALRIAEHPVLILSAVIALAGLASLVLLAPIRNGDFAWHLALGRWMATTGTIPTLEPFTYTAYGAPMVAHEWLSQWIYWQIAEEAGVATLRAAHAVGAALFVGGVFVGLRRAAVSPALALLGCVILVAAAIDRFQVRPHIVNLCFGLGLYVCAFVERPQLSRGQIAAFAAAVAVWANAHSGAVLFPALLLGYALFDAIDRQILRRDAFEPRALGGGDPKRVWQLAAACSLALLATPNHIRLLPYLLKSGPVNAEFSLEWLSILRIAQQPGFEISLVAWSLTLLGALTATGVVFREGRRLAPAAVALACALAPLQSVRFIWLVFAPVIFALSEFSRFASKQTPATRTRLSIATSVLACLAIPWLTWPTEGLAARLSGLSRAGAFAANAFPVRSAHLLSEFLADGPLQGRLFARAEWGGYLTLTLDDRYPIFADGRWVTIGKEVVRTSHRIATGRDGALQLADDFDLDILLVERDWLESRAQERDAVWLVAFEAYNSQILLRRDPSGAANRQRFAKYYASLGIPFDSEQGFDAFDAWNANHSWARSHGVRRKHIRHFYADGSGRRSELGFEVTDWEQRQPEPR
ncbi:MAG: hypothetical protein VX246_14055 [Myxococcota bacterium]|nr:hypothetical protein [Myxococcota bacterium]